MTFKKFGRLACVLALTGLCATAPILSGCSTAHPSADVTLEFNGESYVLSYKLYRNMYPQTVKHFIELANEGFYNNTIIHNYTDSYWYGGGYGYEETSYAENAAKSASNAMAEYLETNSKEKEYYNLANPLAGKITPSVYKSYVDGNYVDAYRSLIGEFSNNKHTIENNALNSSYGCLRMYYTSKTVNSKEVTVVLDKDNTPGELLADYTKNSATSLFNIQISTSTSADSAYCIFGVLQNTDELTELRDAIATYISDTDGVTASSFKKSSTIYIDNYDDVVEPRVKQATYSVPQKAIVVKSVKITKY